MGGYKKTNPLTPRATCAPTRPRQCHSYQVPFSISQKVDRVDASSFRGCVDAQSTRSMPHRRTERLASPTSAIARVHVLRVLPSRARANRGTAEPANSTTTLSLSSNRVSNERGCSNARDQGSRRGLRRRRCVRRSGRRKGNGRRLGSETICTALGRDDRAQRYQSERGSAGYG